MTAQPVFYYDVSSPYAYLAAARVDEILPVRPEWPWDAVKKVVDPLEGPT